MKDFLMSLRPNQWTKNLVLFAGIIFAQQFFNLHLIIKSVIAFTTFCMLASGIYLINDIKDKDKDRLHPIKKDRPIASGKVKIRTALITAVILAVVSLSTAFFLNVNYFILLCSYMLVMLAYSMYLKHVVIVDILIIAGGFVLRAVAGAAVVDVRISSWLLVCTTFIALFLVISKRRHEVLLLGDDAKEHRGILVEYGDRFLDQMIAVVTTATLMAYILYTVDAATIQKFGSDKLIFTAPFVLFGIFRYLYLVYQKNKGGRPEHLLFDDLPLMIAVILWIITAIIIIY